MSQVQWRRWACVLLVALVAACGGSGGGTSTPPPVVAGISLFAGSLQSVGSADGTGDGARFHLPSGIAQAPDGTVYVADSSNHTVRKIDANGMVSTFAGAAGQTGYEEGTGGQARFTTPFGIVADRQGNVYVSDYGNRAIRRLTPGGVVTTMAGANQEEGNIDGVGAAARFTQPADLAIDPAGNLYVAQRSAIRRVAPDGTVTTFAGKADEPGFVVADGAQARFTEITGVAADAAGNVYVSEFATNPAQSPKGRVRRYDNQGRALPWGSAAQGIVLVDMPAGLAVDTAGHVLVGSSGAWGSGSVATALNAIHRISPEGSVVRIAGGLAGHVDGAGPDARFNGPTAVAAALDGGMFVAETGNHAIRRVSAQGVVTTVAGGSGVGRVDGAATVARFWGPRGITAAADGSLYVADTSNALIRKVGADGSVSTVVHRANDIAFTPFRAFQSVAVSADGTVYVSYVAGPSASTRQVFVAAIDTSGNLRDLDHRSALSGTPRVALHPDGRLLWTQGPSIEMLHPDGRRQVVATSLGDLTALAVGADGTVYVANATSVHALDALGNIRLVAGAAFSNGYADGAGEAARFDRVGAITVDASGQLYVADIATVRRVAADGRVQTIAGAPGRDTPVPGALPGSVGRVRGLTWLAGMLYATVDNAVLRIGPAN